MPTQSPSIQSFFSSSATSMPSSPSQASASSQPQLPSSSCHNPGDGFSPEEIEAVLHPPLIQWTPTQDYDETNIGALERGPKPVTFMGRIANMYNMAQSSKRLSAVKGCLKILVADETGAMTVRLWYATIDYKARIGQLVTIWTVHVSHGESNSLAPSSAPLFTSIFPERERSCYIMLHENSDDGIMCKTPSGYRDSQSIPGLITVKNFADGGYDIYDCKLLVCVKSVGARKKFTNKNGTTSEFIGIGVFDDTGEATLTLYGVACNSASSWKPSHTVLLITNPGWKIDRVAKLSLSANTRVDVDPDIKDAMWLRVFAQRITKKEHINPPFSDGVFDVQAAENASIRTLYNLGDIDDFARSNPKERFMGYISVLITELNIVTYYRRDMLMCTECCGVSIYANATSTKCKQCEKQVALRINPRILGPIIDETGQISGGKLIFSDAAWEQLLGRTADQLVDTDIDVLNYLEQRMLFLRVSLGFGWCIEGGVPEPEEFPKQSRKRKMAGTQEWLTSPKKKSKGASKGKGRVDQKQDDGSSHIMDNSLGEVGRLCIWCVKM